MRIVKTKRFEAIYLAKCKTYPNLKQDYIETLELFSLNPTDPILRLHELGGSMSGLLAVSVGHDFRLICKPIQNGFLLVDIGIHKEVYRV